MIIQGQLINGVDIMATALEYQKIRAFSDRPDYQDLLFYNMDSRVRTVWNWVTQLNTSGSAANYHSNDHMLQVAFLANWLVFKEQGINNTDMSISSVPVAMHLACLLHDFKHSLGKTDDDENISIACSYARKILLPYFDTDVVEQTCKYIRITRFPFMSENNPTDLHGRAIRDADLLYSMETDPAKRLEILTKLCVELGRPTNDTETMLLEQEKFWASCEMFTTTGALLRNLFVDKIINKLIE